MIPGGWEWIVIVLIVLLLFGGKKLPELARSVGKSIVEFKRGMKGAEEEPEEQQSASSGNEGERNAQSSS